MAMSTSSREIPELFHISFNRHLPSVLDPRQPWGGEVEPTEDDPKSKDPDAWIFAEFKTPRVSFSPTLADCVKAVFPNTHQLFQSPKGLKEGCEFAVYKYDPRSRAKIMFPEDLCEQRAVWDAHITKEHCFLEPVSVYFCGTVIIKLLGNFPGIMVHPFNDQSMKQIKSNVPTADDLSFKQTLRLRGEKFKVKFF